MNNDIVPSLLEEIQKQFDEEIKANEKIKSILIKLFLTKMGGSSYVYRQRKRTGIVKGIL